jgi:hypothetical protein
VSAGSLSASGTGEVPPAGDRTALAPTTPARWVRLRYRLESQGAVWSHFVPAGEGADAPRNHVLLDPEAPFRAWSEGFVRPIELWRAPHWQRPASATVVRYVLDDAPADSGLPGDAVRRDDVVRFLGDVSAYRLGALGMLLDAVAHALDGGPRVVLAAPTADEGALWLGAASFFASPTTCLRLSFSTHEHLDDVLAGVAGEGHPPAIVSVVPQEELDHLGRRSKLPVTVVDPRVEAVLTAVGGVEHRENHLAQLVPVSDWSRLALDVCCEEERDVARVVARVDRMSVASLQGEWDGDTWQGGVGPAWPLAAAVAVSGGFSLAMPTATRVLLRDTPEAVRLGGELAATLTALVTETMHDAADAWAGFQEARSRAGVSTAHVQAAFESYVRLALVDDAWLASPAPWPDDVPMDAGIAERFQQPVADAVARLRARGAGARAGEAAQVERGVVLLRTIDVLDRLEKLVGDLDLGVAGVRALAAEAATLLSGPVGAQIAEVVGVLEGDGVRRWVLPAMSRLRRDWSLPAGETLPPSVASLLASAVDVEELLAVPSPEALARDRMAVEIVVAGATGRVVGDLRLRGPAAEYLLHELASRRARGDDAAPPRLPATWASGVAPGGPEPGGTVEVSRDAVAVEGVLARVGGDRPWTAAELIRLRERADASLLPAIVAAAARRVGEWGRDADAARLAAGLLKVVQFVPGRAADGRPRRRLAGVTDADVDVLNLVAATGDGWLTQDNGLHRRAAEILFWADGAWTGTNESAQRVIAPRVLVAAFQAALAVEPSGSADPERARDGERLRSRIGVVPLGMAWRRAVPLGIDEGLPMLQAILSMHRYRLAGELVCALTRSMVGVPPPAGDAVPPLAELPVGVVVRSLVAADDAPPELRDHLARLVEQELYRQGASTADARRLVAFWSRALPGGDFGDFALLPELETTGYRAIGSAGRVPAGDVADGDGERVSGRRAAAPARDGRRRGWPRLELPPRWMRPRRWLRRPRHRGRRVAGRDDRRPGGSTRP